jgi:hypothetical protein
MSKLHNPILHGTKRFDIGLLELHLLEVGFWEVGFRLKGQKVSKYRATK